MSGLIACATHGGTRLLKLSGELRHDNAAALEELIERWFEPGSTPVSEVIIDLNELKFMDSTVIGLLAAIARGLSENQRPQALVFSTQLEINQLLRSLQLDRALVLIERASAVNRDLAPSELADNGVEQVSAHSILRAHELLMSLSESNRAAFAPVVELLREQIDSDPAP